MSRRTAITSIAMPRVPSSIRASGFDPPLGSLRYWIQGVPDPASPAKEKVDPQQQRLQSLEQDGWQIDYTGYMPSGGVSLPAKLTLQRAGVRVRLVVDGWNS